MFFTRRSSFRREMGPPSRPGPLVPVLLALAMSACVTSRPDVALDAGSDDALRSRELQQLAQSVMTDSGHVSVKVDGDVCFVYGFVESAIDEKQILRALESADGISTVRNGLQREM